MRVNLSIDPGLSGTGLAIWNRKEVLQKKKGTAPIKVCNLYPSKESTTLMGKTRSLLAKIDHECVGLVVMRIDIEMPAFFDDAGGHMAAKKGDLLKLTFFVGAIASHFKYAKIRLHTPQEWKGQLSKEQVIRKLQHINPNLKCTSHSWDAVGIGYFAAGMFKR